MKQPFLLFIGLLLLSACVHPHSNQKSKEAAAPVEIQPVNNNDTIPVIFAKGTGRAEVREHLKGLADSKIFVFEAKKGQTLIATLKTPVTPGNVRIKQIVNPLEVAESPLCSQINTNITASGRWKLIVDESNMVGEEYVGDFTLTIELK